MKIEILKYIKILWKGMTGIGIELMYPVFIFLAAALLSGILYLIFPLTK